MQFYSYGCRLTVFNTELLLDFIILVVGLEPRTPLFICLINKPYIIELYPSEKDLTTASFIRSFLQAKCFDYLWLCLISASLLTIENTPQVIQFSLGIRVIQHGKPNHIGHKTK